MPPDANDHLLVAATLLHKVDAPPYASGFMGFIDAAGAALNPRNHRPGKMQSWLSHFSMLLKFEGDDSAWLVQRDTHGIDYHRVDCAPEPLVVGARVRTSPDRPESIVCDVSDRDSHWHTPRSWGEAVRRRDIDCIVRQERLAEYHVVTKNCQHFCHDIYFHTLEHAFREQFHEYTERCQSVFCEKMGPWS